jgi:hypothetical protein
MMYAISFVIEIIVPVIIGAVVLVVQQRLCAPTSTTWEVESVITEQISDEEYASLFGDSSHDR